MSDRIGVMDAGRLLQVGSPKEVYERPGSRFVADFIGDITFLPAVVVDGGAVRLADGSVVRAATGLAPGTEATVALRPERFELFDLDEPVPEGLNRVPGRVMRRMYYGDSFFYDIETAAGPVEAREENRPGVELYEVGERTIVAWDPVAGTVVDD